MRSQSVSLYSMRIRKLQSDNCYWFNHDEEKNDIVTR